MQVIRMQVIRMQVSDPNESDPTEGGWTVPFASERPPYLLRAPRKPRWLLVLSVGDGVWTVPFVRVQFSYVWLLEFAVASRLRPPYLLRAPRKPQWLLVVHFLGHVKRASAPTKSGQFLLSDICSSVSDCWNSLLRRRRPPYLLVAAQKPRWASSSFASWVCKATGHFLCMTSNALLHLPSLGGSWLHVVWVLFCLTVRPPFLHLTSLTVSMAARPSLLRYEKHRPLQEFPLKVFG